MDTPKPVARTKQCVPSVDRRATSTKPVQMTLTGNHSASSKECPKWKYERKLLELVHIEKLTFHEAKQRITTLVNTTAPTRLVSEVVKSNFKKVEMKTVGVQTTDTHCSTCTCQVRPSISVQTIATENETDTMETETPSAQGRKRHYDRVEEDGSPSQPEEDAHSSQSSKSHSPSKREHKTMSPPPTKRDHKRAANAHSPSKKGSSRPGSPSPSDGRRSRSRSPVHKHHGSLDRGRTKKKINR